MISRKLTSDRTYSASHENMADQRKAEILLVGCGGVGTMCAYNLEIGSQVNVTAVLRSNYDAVDKTGFSITSIEHGEVAGWRPSTSDTIPVTICMICPDQ